MDLPVYNNSQLAALFKTEQDKKDTQMIRRIVQQIHSAVVSSARDGLKQYKWNSELYLFDNFQDYELRHIVEACKQVQLLFPDSDVTRPRPKEILIQWY